MDLNKEHPFISSIKGCKMSPLLKDIVSYVGQSECYESSSEVIEKTMGLRIDDNKIHRLCNDLGEKSAEWLDDQRKDNDTKPEISQDTEVLYAHCDGGYVLTREEKWKEVKVGRVYSSNNLLKTNDKRGYIDESWYTFHIGDHTTFEEKMEQYLDSYKYLKERMVFIVDGAIWIHNWINEKYPCALKILDFFHAYEKICYFSTKVISDKIKRKKWQIDMHAKLLKEGGQEVIKEIEKITCISKSKSEEKEKLLGYLRRNETRMNYPSYLKQGLQIGSGAMEAAHRTLVQKRCKLSGQRWTEKGATNVISLRNLNMNNKWSVLQEYLRNTA